MKKIVLFASGAGTNAENIIRHFQKKQDAEVVAVFSNNPKAQVLEKAENLKVSVAIFTKEALNEGLVLEKLHALQPDLIVLAGFLLQFPKNIIDAYPKKIINIHPALLPQYGGKGMYGMNVHRAIIENNETETGITIHYVNENYDEGNIIFQKSIALNEKETPETIAEKVHLLEQQCFPEVIENILNNSIKNGC